MKGMILAAGIGSRLRPITDNIPKALLPVHERPLLDYAICYFRRFGIHDVIINIHHHGQQIVDFVKTQAYSDMNITFSDETDQLLNTGGGVKKASGFFEGDENMVLMASDVITDLPLDNLIQAHQHSHADVTLAVKKRETSRSLLFNENDELTGWRDNQTGETRFVGSNRVFSYDAGFSGIHVVSTRLFPIMPAGPFSITDFYLDIGANHSIKAFRHDTSTWLEFGRISKIRQIESSGIVHQIVDW